MRRSPLLGQPALLVVLSLLAAACSAGGPSPSPAGPAAGSPSTSAAASTSTSPSPCASPTVPSTACPSATGTAIAGSTPRPSPSPLAYVVRPGDTLTSIANGFDTTARSIAFWNRAAYPTLDPQSPAYAPNRIEVGWTLRIWPGAVVDEANLLPGPSPSPVATLTLPAGPTPAPDRTSVVVSNGPRGGDGVALTFDMGGRLDPALDIVDWLIANDVQATIFPTGKTASTTDVGQAVMARVAAHPELFSVGNHTWDHPDMTTLSAAAMTTELQDTEAAVRSLTGLSTMPFYRPPYGTQDLASRRVAGGLGWAFTILWDVDTIDWKAVADGGPTADDIVARVLSRARGGSIVLMHLGGYETYAALPRIVAGLRTLGLQPVTLAELLGT